VAELHLSLHAAEKMRSRGVSLSEVEQCVWKPDVTYGNEHGEVRQCGSIAVGVRVIEGGDVVVRTVLLRHTEQWTDEQARNRSREASR
jgi:hypothetical protein